MRLLTGKDKVRWDHLCHTEGRVQGLLDNAAWLEGHIHTLKAMLAEERGRANAAVDELLSLKGLAPVTPPKPVTLPVENPWEEDPHEVNKWRSLIEREGLVAAFETEEN